MITLKRSLIAQSQKLVTAYTRLQLKNVGPKLVPFVKTTIVYFVAWIPKENPSPFAALLKCLPILCLIAFVLMQGISLEPRHDYNRRILVGLIFSCIGDALLIWPKSHFVKAIAAFGVAHIAYLRAFGLKPPYCWLKGIPFLGFFFIAMYVFYPVLYGGLFLAVTVYILLINFMTWRAFAQVDILENLWSWTKLCACIGASFFLVSDFVIGLNKFVVNIPAARAIIMTTYYAAQLFIALSAAKTEDLVSSLNQKKR